MIYIGTSGYLYQHWNNGVFYPKGVRDKLAYYLERFNTVEINSSFYSIPKPEAVAAWNAKLPKDFRIVLKAPRSVTHNRMLRLRNKENAEIKQGVDLLDYFLHSFLRISERKQGPVLVQTPEKLKFDADRLYRVLRMCSAYEFQVAFEPRHESWNCPKTFELLEEYSGSLVVADWPAFETPLVLTSDFIYVRRHGVNGSYAGEYSAKQMRADAELLFAHKNNHDIYVYFNNDIGGAAPRNALQLKKILDRMQKEEYLQMSDEY